MTSNRKENILNNLFLFLLALATVSLVQKHFQVEYRGRIVPEDASEFRSDSEALRAHLSKPAPYPRALKGYQAIPFEQLTSFELQSHSEVRKMANIQGSLPVVPERVKKLHGSRISVSGFMVPIKFHDTLASEFLLVPNRSLCCYGQDPKINERILVQTSRPQRLQSDKPVTVSGEMIVEEISQEDVVHQLYKLSAHRVDVFQDD